MNSVAIRALGLHKTFSGKPPVKAVNGIDIEIQRGQCFGLLGPNGAGKTTTMEMLEGLLAPSSGTIEILSMKWGTDDQKIKNKIGISLQETRLAERLTVFETVRMFQSFYSHPMTPENAIEAVSLQEKSNTYVERLSGGQRQRLAIAAAIIGQPEILFLDEPTTGLDPQSRRQLWDIINEYRAQGRTIVLTTHYMDEAERLCDTISIVDHGKVIAHGTPSQLILDFGGENIVEFQLETRNDQTSIETFAKLTGVVKAWTSDNSFLLSVIQPHVTIAELFQWCSLHQTNLASLTTRHATLEDVFINLTGRHLRDGDS